MTKKLTGLIVALVLLLSALLGGCGMFTENISADNDETVMVVGNQKVSKSAFLAAFNNLYNTYYSSYASYISQGYITEQQFGQMIVEAAYTQMATTFGLVDEYKTILEDANKTKENSYSDTFSDAIYVTDEDMIEVLSLAKYSLYNTLDSLVRSEISKTHTFEATTTATDEVREAPTYENITNAYGLSGVNFSMDTDAAKEYLLHAPGDLKDYTTFDDTYIFYDITDANLAFRLAALNEQLDDTIQDYKPITADEYVAAQRVALASLRQQIYNDYNLKFDGFTKLQIEENLTNMLIVYAQRYVTYNAIEQDKEQLVEMLEDIWAANVNAAQLNYTLDPEAYQTYATSMDNLFIYYTPTQYPCVYVKNLLIKFDDTQNARINKVAEALTTLQTKASAATSTTEEESLNEQVAEAKIKLEETKKTIATELLIKDYLDDEQSLKRFFTLNDDGELVVDEQSDLYLGFTDSKGNTVKGLKDVANGDDFMQLLYRYNQDVASHTLDKDYVANVKPSTSFTTDFVAEFDDACKKLVLGDDEENPDNIGDNIGKYEICISEYQDGYYGLHIIYYVGDVEAQTPDFTLEKIYDTSTLEYKFFKSYFDTVNNTYLTDKRTEISRSVEIKVKSYLRQVFNSYGMDTPDLAAEEE